ncbi:MAG: hypothetical protein LBR73_03310 [Oscillospiraceae bacterium]|nr:hypothetical protein [Oscillospiraceae bacterium]
MKKALVKVFALPVAVIAAALLNINSSAAEVLPLAIGPLADTTTGLLCGLGTLLGLGGITAVLLRKKKTD